MPPRRVKVAFSVFVLPTPRSMVIAPLAFTALYRAYHTPVVIALYASAALLITALVLRLSRIRRE